MHRTCVLVVDDDMDILDLIQTALMQAGIANDGATSAEEAMELMRKNLYLVVLADIHMPGSSGVELISALKKFSPLVQVIMLTADSTTQQVIACADRGAADFFSKTTGLEPVLKSIRAAMERVERWSKLIGQNRQATANASIGASA